MAIPKLIMGLMAILLIAWVLSMMLGVGVFAVNTILLSVFIVLLLQKFNVFRVFPVKRTQETAALIVLGIVVFAVGGFAMLPMVGDILNPDAIMGGAAPISGAVTTVPAGTTGVCPVSAELAGKDATVTVLAYDQQSNTPYSSSVTGAIDYYYQLNGGPVRRGQGLTSITASVGDELKIYERGENTSQSYYVEPVTKCITKQTDSVEVRVHKKATLANMQVTGYDRTGGTALTDGDSKTEDYHVTLGADETEKIFLELSTQAANVARREFAVAVLTTNDIKDARPTDSVWTEAIVADFLDVDVANNTAGTALGNITGGYEKVYTLSSARMLPEWEYSKYGFTIEAGSTDPTGNDADFNAGDLAIFCFLDAAGSRDKSGAITAMDYYQHDDSQGDVGVADYGEITVPIGKDTCTVIEGN